MKKFLTFALVCCLVFSSSSIAFASPTQWDTSDRTLLSNIATTLTSTGTGTLLRSVNAILTALTSTTQQGSLYNGVAYLYDIREAVQSISTAVGSGSSSVLNNILNALMSTDAAGIATSFLQLLLTENVQTNSHLQGIYNKTGDLSGSKYVTMMRYQNGSLTFETRQMSIFDSINTLHNYGLLPFAQMVIAESNQNNLNYNSTQNAVNWGSLGNASFTPSSSIDGIYKWFAAIQAPVARLAYVLANDQEIAARNAASANQTAVVNNFIDPNGAGSLPTSSIGSVSDMSDSFKDNFSTDASPTGLFDIFNSDHGSWFSQETADQLDTTNINARSLKAAPSNDFDTPLLDQQIDDIYNALGVKK